MSLLTEIIANNHILQTGLGLGSAGIISFWLKDVPGKIVNFFKREFTTSVTITSQHNSFYNFLKWIETNYKNENFRQLKISNGRWGEENVVFTVGYGWHVIWFKRTPLFVWLEKDQANQTERDKELVVITKFGRSKALFQDLLTEIEKQHDLKNKVKLHKYNGDWHWLKDVNKRSLDSIFIEQEKKDLLISRIESFIKDENWYLEKGIPYQLGIMLYGPPGTGKTSLIKAIASHFSYPIYYIPTNAFLKIEDAFEKLQEKCVIVIEDIDCQTFTHSREDDDFKEEFVHKTNTDKLKSGLGMAGLSEILNAIDGFAGVDGRILIATTNHIEKLDSALLRPGRFDLKIGINYVSNEILESFFKNFFPLFDKSLKDIKIKPAITVASLQEMVLENFSAEQILAKICYE
jgi:chaperone BCS1